MGTPFQARGFGQNGKSIYANITKLQHLHLAFTVAPANGLGVTSVKSNGYVRNVFMHTSGAPTSNNGYLNPNPAAGLVLIQAFNNFNKFLGVNAHLISPNSGANVAVTAAAHLLVVGGAYTITVVGTTTTAQWQALGLPAGLTPTVGQSFIALITGIGAGTGQVQVPSASGVMGLELIGDPNQEIASDQLSVNGGAWLLGQFLAPTVTAGAYGTPMIATAPATGTIVELALIYDGSSVTIDGL